MAEFWAWAQGDGRSTFRDAPPLPGTIEAVKRPGPATAWSSSAPSSTGPSPIRWPGWPTIAGAREFHFLWDKTLAECDIYLDDVPHQLRELEAGLPGAIVCRMAHPWSEPLDGVFDIHSWEEFERVVERVAAERESSRDK